MLELTDSAAEAVRALVAAADETAETGGLRVAAEDQGEQVSLQFNVAVVPAEDDEVVEEYGARVFLEPTAASLLEDKILDAAIEDDRIAFVLMDRP
jgi:iron-sulfur cluster assembly protein